MVRLSALLKGAFALILKIAILLFWGTSAPKHKHFSAGKLHFVRLFEQARKGWLFAMKKNEKRLFTLSCAAALLFAVPSSASAMHIMEGYLPIGRKSQE